MEDPIGLVLQGTLELSLDQISSLSRDQIKILEDGIRKDRAERGGAAPAGIRGRGNPLLASGRTTTSSTCTSEYAKLALVD